MTAHQLHDCESVHGYVGRICFKNGPPSKVGAELEFLLAGADPREPVSLARVRAALLKAPPFPGGSSLTFEPGGQVELSSQAATGLTALVSSLQCDVDHLVDVLASAGVTLVDSAVDPCRTPLRQLRSRRYDAMESYFDHLEHDVPEMQRVGRAMMASTAATQLNLDAGTDPAERWRLLHDLGPVLVAAFANSPMRLGRPTGWKSSRQQIWQTLDPRRTAEPLGDDPVAAFADFVLDSPVMLLRHPTKAWRPGPGFTFRDWVESGAGPTEDDLAYHLTTLFPPVRPRGWFEVRYLDTQPLAWWQVPVAVLSALLDDPLAASLAAEAAEPARGRWETAARVGLDDPALRAAARRCFGIAIDSLSRHDPLLVGVVCRFAEHYVEQGRCPADDAAVHASAQEVG
jgi:glutamate--cysteine ligase